MLRKEIISSIVSDELTKPTRRLILLQMFTKQTLQNTQPKNLKKKTFLLQNVGKKNYTKLDQKKQQKISHTAALMLIVQLVNWQFGIIA